MRWKIIVSPWFWIAPAFGLVIAVTVLDANQEPIPSWLSTCWKISVSIFGLAVIVRKLCWDEKLEEQKTHILEVISFVIGFLMSLFQDLPHSFSRLAHKHK